jgi:hypothetical protein
VTPWPYNEKPAGFTLPDFGLTAEQNQELTETIWAALVTGEDDAEDFADAEGDDWPLTPEQLTEAFAFAHAARVSQQEQWTPAQTQTNLDLAFDDLNNAGILARQNFTCCGNCGSAEIGDEQDDSRHWNGYVFFHQQDTQTLVDSGSVYLSYGVFQPENFDEAAYDLLPKKEQEEIYLAGVLDLVNSQVIPRLTARGLTVEWNGKHSTRILVKGAQWYCPL